MALNTRNKIGGVVSNATGGGPVVLGSRGVRGRVIGEVLSGGRNILGVRIRERQAPRPTGQSARHKLRPAAKKTDDYSDFGFDDDIDDYDDGDYANTGQARSYRAPSGISRPEAAAAPSPAAEVLAAALGGQGLLLVLVFFYAILGRDIIELFAWMLASPLPLLLAVFLGYRAGRHAKRKFNLGTPFPYALLGGILGALVVGGALYAYARHMGFVTLSYAIATLGLDFPRDVYEYANIIDMGVRELFSTFRLGTYAVVPLFGAALGWLFGRRY